MKAKWIGPDGDEIEMQSLFTISIDENGHYLATRSEEPMFCVHGITINEAVDQAVCTFTAYKDLTTTKD